MNREKFHDVFEQSQLPWGHYPDHGEARSAGECGQPAHTR